jgi:hypothetical protein
MHACARLLVSYPLHLPIMPFVTLPFPDARRVKVPDAEFRVLEILSASSSGMTGPSIARASNGDITINSVYTLLKRMVVRGVAVRFEIAVQIMDVEEKRICYKLPDGLSLP